MQVSRGSAKQCLYRRVVGKTVAGIIALLGFVFMIGILILWTGAICRKALDPMVVASCYSCVEPVVYYYFRFS